MGIGRSRENARLPLAFSDYIYAIMAHYAVTRRRHALHLHAPFGADKENFGVGVPALYGRGYGKCRKNVAAGATSAYQYFHIFYRTIYASGPTLKAAQRAGVPTLLQEQNSYPGVTNKLLAPRAAAICVAPRPLQCRA